MVNDLEKLNKVIGSLEEQASRVSQFNGILHSVNEARSEIESSKVALTSLVNAQSQIITETYSKFDEIDKRLPDLLNSLVNAQRQIIAETYSKFDKFDKRLPDLLNSLTNAQRQIVTDSISKFDGFDKRLSELLTSLVNAQRQIIADTYSKFDEFNKRLPDLDNKISGLGNIQDQVLRNLLELKFLTPEQYEQGRSVSDATLRESVSDLIRKIEKANQMQHAALRSIKVFTILGVLMLAGVIAFVAFSIFLHW